MRYGLTLPNGGVCGDPRTLAELVSLAEQAGWDGVFLEDYIIWQGHFDQPTYDPWIALAALAMHTQQIRSLAEAGATLWNEYMPPDESTRMQAWIEQGPLRVE